MDDYDKWMNNRSKNYAFFVIFLQDNFITWYFHINIEKKVNIEIANCSSRNHFLIIKISLAPSCKYTDGKICRGRFSPKKIPFSLMTLKQRSQPRSGGVRSKVTDSRSWGLKSWSRSWNHCIIEQIQLFNLVDQADLAV